jgi:Beta-propeller repeat
VSRLQGSLAIEVTGPVQGSTATASARLCWAAVGLLIPLSLVAVATRADRESQLVQDGSGAAQSVAGALPTSLGTQSASLAPTEAAATMPPASTTRRAASAYAKLPLSFVPNARQTDASVRYYAQGAGYSFYFTHDKAVLALNKGHRGVALELRFLGASPNTKLTAADRAGGRVNYFTDSEQHTNLPSYGRLAYRNLWPGIDLVFAGKGGNLSYAFHLRPGAKVSDIRLAYAGADDASLGPSGALRIDTPLGTLKDARPHSFQHLGGGCVPVNSRYALAGNSYGFSVGSHDPRKPLVIDPSLAYSTYLGGSDFDGRGLGIAVDSAGSAYVTGSTASPDFPTTAGAFDTSFNHGPFGQADAFVTKLNPAGSGLTYSTFLGGSFPDSPSGIAVDSAGSAYVTGTTASTDFPTTPGAFDTSPADGINVFVTKLNPAGSSLAFSTILGAVSSFNLLSATGIAVDSAGAAYVTGSIDSASIPTTAGAFDTSFNGTLDAFVTKLNPAGQPVRHRSRFGGVRVRQREHRLHGLPHYSGGLRHELQRPGRLRSIRHQAGPGRLRPRLFHLPGCRRGLGRRG